MTTEHFNALFGFRPVVGQPVDVAYQATAAAKRHLNGNSAEPIQYTLTQLNNSWWLEHVNAFGYQGADKIKPGMAITVKN